MKKTLLILLTIFLAVHALQAQEKYYRPAFSAGAYYTYVPDHEGIYDRLFDSGVYPTYAVAVTFNTSPDSPKSDFFTQLYNYPTFGIGFSVSDLSKIRFKNNSHFSNIYTGYVKMEYALLRNSVATLGISMEEGMAYTKDLYDPYTNPCNTYFGQHSTIYFSVGPQIKVRPTPNLELVFNGLFWHHSSGNESVPNTGFNEFAAGAFVRYNLEPPYTGKMKLPERPSDFKKHIETEIFALGGIHSCKTEWHAFNELVEDPAEKQVKFRHWPRGGVGMDISYRYGLFTSTGVAFDFLYSSNSAALERSDIAIYGEEAVDGVSYNPFTLDLGLVQKIFYRNVAFYISLGGYVFRDVGIHETFLTTKVSKLYQKIGLRVYFPKMNDVFLGWCIKANNFNDADYFEFHLGVRI
jgi:hypothetical protein